MDLLKLYFVTFVMQFVVGKRVGTDFFSTRRIVLLKIDIKSDSIRGKKKSVENM